jgi:hypothetical protein
VAVVIKNGLRIKVGGTIVHGTGFVNCSLVARTQHTASGARPIAGLEKHNDIPDTSRDSIPLRN